jgi:hypothetical protein
VPFAATGAFGHTLPMHATADRLNDPDHSDALRKLRRFRAGTLVYDGVPLARKFVIDGRNGRVVLPAPTDAIEAEELILWLPEERFGAMQALLYGEELEAEFDEARDRFLAYHGRADQARWLTCAIESVRDGAEIYDGEALTAANAARPVESRLCKLLNADEDRLRTLTARMAGVMPETALAVGVDEDGIDVRVSLGVVRVEFPRRAATPEETEGTVRGLLTEIGGA